MIDLIAFTDDNYEMIESLVDESKQEGFALVQRTIDDWNDGTNRFSHGGEGLWGLISGAELIGIGGLNIDPYVEDRGAGRVRHLYIRQAYRRKGCATLLMDTIVGRHDRISASSACLRPTRPLQRFTNIWVLSIYPGIK